MLLGVAQNIPQYAITSSEFENQDKVRDQGFRKAIVNLYDHRCALCGIENNAIEKIDKIIAPG